MEIREEGTSISQAKCIWSTDILFFLCFKNTSMTFYNGQDSHLPFALTRNLVAIYLIPYPPVIRRADCSCLICLWGTNFSLSQWTSFFIPRPLPFDTYFCSLLLIIHTGLCVCVGVHAHMCVGTCGPMDMHVEWEQYLKTFIIALCCITWDSFFFFKLNWKPFISSSEFLEPTCPCPQILGL